MRSMYDQEHDFELSRHEPRPGDRPSPRPELPQPSLLAIETALMVKHEGINLTLAAQLIEEFARAEAARIRLECVAAGANS